MHNSLQQELISNKNFAGLIILKRRSYGFEVRVLRSIEIRRWRVVIVVLISHIWHHSNKLKAAFSTGFPRLNWGVGTRCWRQAKREVRAGEISQCARTVIFTHAGEFYWPYLSCGKRQLVIYDQSRKSCRIFNSQRKNGSGSVDILYLD